MSVTSLIRSAFGHSCLYKSLEVPRSSTSEELKRAYRRLALRYHPDRANFTTKSDDAAVSSTLKFQAVSAAYQILMNEGKRSIYDATGKILDDDYITCDDDDEHDSSPRRSAHSNNDQWESFFYSVFHEIISAKTTNEVDAKNYRGSSREQSDVIKYYSICKGDWDKVVDCIPHGDKSDVKRWKQYVISHALMNRENQNNNDNNDMKPCSKKRALSLDDSFSSQEDIMNINKSKTGTARKQISLEDSSSSEDEQQLCLPGKRRLQKQQPNFHSSKKLARSMPPAKTSMSKKDKLEYRTAKKQKEKRKKEIEVAELFQSKNWSGVVASECIAKSRKMSGPLNSQVLDRMGQKYGKRTKRRSK